MIINLDYEDQFLQIFCGPFDNKSPIVIALRRKYLHCIQERKIFDTKSLEDVTCPLSQPRTCRLRSLSHDVMSQKCIQRPKVDLTESKKKGVWMGSDVRTFVYVISLITRCWFSDFSIWFGCFLYIQLP